jgi:hypothetical protein
MTVVDSKCTCGNNGVGANCNVGDSCNIKQYKYPDSKLVLRTEWDGCLKVMDEKKITDETERHDNCSQYLGCLIEQVSTKVKDADATTECGNFDH